MAEIKPSPVSPQLVGAYSFFVEGIPELPNRTRGQHWSKTSKEKAEWENRIGWLAKAKRIPLMVGKVHIKFTIQIGRNGRVDPDNLMWSTTKPALDSLQKCGILVDDTIDHVELSYAFSREKPRGFWIEIKPI